MPHPKMASQVIASVLIAYSLLAFAQQKQMNDYSSPKAVYESMRDAGKRRDWKSYLACLTTAAQKDELLEMFWLCAEGAPEKARPILGPFIGDPRNVFEDYEKRKKAKLRALEEKGDKAALKHAQENYKTVSNDDFKDTLFEHIPDKAAYYGAARALLQSDLTPDLGEFEDAVITGDSATGTAKIKSYYLDGGKKTALEDNKMFSFRRADGKWLIDIRQ
jgi:hypothetical protein